MQRRDLKDPRLRWAPQAGQLLQRGQRAAIPRGDSLSFQPPVLERPSTITYSLAPLCPLQFQSPLLDLFSRLRVAAQPSSSQRTLSSPQLMEPPPQLNSVPGPENHSESERNLPS